MVCRIIELWTSLRGGQAGSSLLAARECLYSVPLWESSIFREGRSWSRQRAALRCSHCWRWSCLWTCNTFADFPASAFASECANNLVWSRELALTGDPWWALAIMRLWASSGSRSRLIRLDASFGPARFFVPPSEGCCLAVDINFAGVLAPAIFLELCGSACKVFLRLRLARCRGWMPVNFLRPVALHAFMLRDCERETSSGGVCCQVRIVVPVREYCETRLRPY